MADPTYSYPPASEPGPINDSRYKSIPIIEDSDGTFHNISDGSPMPTKDSGSPSDGSNTLTTPLGSGATFTGEWEQNNQPDVMVSLQTDTSGTLYFEFSVDGTNASVFPIEGFKITSGIHEFHTAIKGPRYFRVRFVNDAFTPTYMRLYTYFGQFRAPSTPLNAPLQIDSDGIATRPTDFQDEVKRGRRVGVTGWNKFGYRLDVPNNTTACIWPAIPLLPTFLTSASTFTVTYNSTTDGSGTTGATELVFIYIDDDGLPATSTHTLGSDGSDVTSFSGLGINRIAVTAAGSAGFNTNDITVTATTGATVQAVVPAENSITQQAIFFVGANHVAIAPWLTIEMAALDKDKALVLLGYTWNRTSGVRTEVFRGSIDRSLDLHRQIFDPIKFRLEANSVLYFIGTTSGHNSVLDMSCRFSLNEYQLT